MHPNVYLLASVIKDELAEAHDDGDSAAIGIEVLIIYKIIIYNFIISIIQTFQFKIGEKAQKSKT